MWERITSSAEKYNEPGKFTAFIGYRMDLHPRQQPPPNVIFRDGKAKADQIVPFSAI